MMSILGYSIMLGPALQVLLEVASEYLLGTAFPLTNQLANNRHKPTKERETLTLCILHDATLI